MSKSLVQPTALLCAVSGIAPVDAIERPYLPGQLMAANRTAQTTQQSQAAYVPGLLKKVPARARANLDAARICGVELVLEVK